LANSSAISEDTSDINPGLNKKKSSKKELANTSAISEDTSDVNPNLNKKPSRKKLANSSAISEDNGDINPNLNKKKSRKELANTSAISEDTSEVNAIGSLKRKKSSKNELADTPIASENMDVNPGLKKKTSKIEGKKELVSEDTGVGRDMGTLKKSSKKQVVNVPPVSNDNMDIDTSGTKKRKRPLNTELTSTISDDNPAKKRKKLSNKESVNLAISGETGNVSATGSLNKKNLQKV